MRILLSSDLEVIRYDVDFYNTIEEKLESGIWYVNEEELIYNQLHTCSYSYEGIGSYSFGDEHYRFSFHDPVTKRETMLSYNGDLEGVIDLSEYVKDNDKITQQEVDFMKMLYPAIPPQILQDLVYIPTKREKIRLTLDSWRSKIKSIVTKQSL